MSESIGGFSAGEFYGFCDAGVLDTCERGYKHSGPCGPGKPSVEADPEIPYYGD